MHFESFCLYCGQSHQLRNYTCNCNSASWFRQYRVTDLKTIYHDGDREMVRESFNKYDTAHQDGIIQYQALPNRSLYTRGIPAPGSTPLYKTDYFSDKYGCDLYVKDEGDNPSGCFKDRETLMCLLNSISKDRKRAVIYSSGNAAASAAVFAQQQDIELLTFVAGDTYPEKIEFIRDHGSDVIVIGDKKTSFEEGYRSYCALIDDPLLAELGFDDWSVRNPYRVQGDKATAIEIVKQLSSEHQPEVPDMIIVPTANGSCLAGIWKGFLELKALGLIDKLPAMVSVGVKGGSPVYDAVRKQCVSRPVTCDISRVKPEDSTFGSIILAEEGYDSPQAAKAVIDSGGTAVELGKDEVARVMNEFINNETKLSVDAALIPEPASVMAIAALEKIVTNGGIMPMRQVVSIMTGHGLKARKRISKMIGQDNGTIDIIDDAFDERQQEMLAEARRPGRVLNCSSQLEEIKKTVGHLI